MEGQKDNVLNLFYLFNEGDLYKVEEDLSSVMIEMPQLNLSVNEVISVAGIPDTTPVEKTNRQPVEPVLEIVIPKEETAEIKVKSEDVVPIPESKTEPVSIVEQPPQHRLCQRFPGNYQNETGQSRIRSVYDWWWGS
jgi:hypothetical protein